MTGLGRSGVGSAAPPARLLHRAVLVRIQPADWQSAPRGDGARPAGGSRSEVDCPTMAGHRRAGPSPPEPATATWVVTDSSGRACRSWCGDVCRRLSAGCPGRYSESSSPRARLPHCSSRGRRREFHGRGRRSEWRLWNPPKAGVLCEGRRVAGRRATPGRAGSAGDRGHVSSIRVAVSPLLSRREFQGHPTVPLGRPIELAPLPQCPESCR